MEKVILLEKIGNAKKGEIFIRGLFGVPESHKKGKYNKSALWWWEENLPKEENGFMPHSVIEYGLKEKTIKYLK